MTSGECAVLQLRLLVETDDYDAAVRFYRDELGLPEQAAFAGAGEARVAILGAGRATLELANRAQRRLIDDAEVGHPSGPRIRVALEVADTIEMTERLVAAGATLVSSPRETPWLSLNARLDAPAGLQLTLFQELEPLAQRAGRPGFGTDARRPAAPPTPRDRRRRRINATPERNRAPESLTPGITG
jgi:catechol 2,3-dioxygenase-like lactoylglutathione lyase family enzyme